MLTAIHTAWVVTQYERGGYKQPALLLDIVNPMAWLTRVEFDVNAVRLAVGLQANNPTELGGLSRLGGGVCASHPAGQYHANMVLALKALGRTAEAESLRSRALQLYPGEPLLTGSAARSVATTLERKPSSRWHDRAALLHNGRLAAVIISISGKLAVSFGGVVSPGDGVAQGGVGVIGSWSSPEWIS